MVQSALERQAEICWMRKIRREINKFSFTLQVWITSLLIGPILLATYLAIFKDDESLAFLAMYFPILSISLILSLPVLLITTIAYIILGSKIKNAFLLKTVLFLVTVAGLVFTFLNLGGSMVYDFIIAYTFSTTAAFFLIRIKKADVEI